MKFKPINVIAFTYCILGVGGLIVIITGMEMKNHALQVAGIVLSLTGILIGSIPLVGTIIYLLLQKIRAKNK